MNKKKNIKSELSPRELRIKYAESLKKENSPLKEEDVRKAFKVYFIQLSRKLKLSSDLENILWLHIKSAGFATPSLFDKGVRHFGYNI